LVAANLQRLEEAALRVYQLGHMPMIGEWVALPLAAAAGSKAVGDAVSEAFLYPVAGRLAQELGLPVYRSLDEIPEPASTAGGDHARI
jgi:hypothetical protein